MIFYDMMGRIIQSYEVLYYQLGYLDNEVIKFLELGEGDNWKA